MVAHEATRSPQPLRHFKSIDDEPASVSDPEAALSVIAKWHQMMNREVSRLATAFRRPANRRGDALLGKD